MAPSTQAEKAHKLLACVSFLLLFSSAHAHNKPGIAVKYLSPPIYPAVAGTAKLEGTVRVKITVSADGKVISADPSGAHEIPNQAAEENIVHWIFQPAAGTWDHTIVYIYKLEGKESYHPRRTRFILDLPDRIELIAQPPKPNE
jgi:TonB family protein